LERDAREYEPPQMGTERDKMLAGELYDALDLVSEMANPG
jgi:hypothetical protein